MRSNLEAKSNFEILILNADFGINNTSVPTLALEVNHDDFHFRRLAS